MRLILLGAILLLSSCVAGLPSQSIEDSILAQAHQCCMSSCSAQEREMMERNQEAYIRENPARASYLRKYIDLANSGEACSSNGRSKRAGYITISNNQGPYDVGTSDVSFTAAFAVNQPAGIYTYYCYAYTVFNGTYSKYVYPTDGSYYDSGSNMTSISKTLTFTIPKYSYYGVYTLYCYAYSAGYTNYLFTQGNFTVIKSNNDVRPPVIISISAPVMNLNDTDRTVALTASDDMSGIQSCYIYIGNATYSYLAYGSFYADYSNGQYQYRTYVVAAISLYFYYTPIAAGTYDILTVSCTDAVGSSMSYNTAQLKAMGMQSNITFAQSKCNAGRKLAYGATGQCTLCDKGTFSGTGAFRCKACLPGTASNVAGITSCVQCVPGTSGIGGSAGCDPCLAGTFSSGYGASDCTPCWPGYNSTDGAETCTPCPYGTYSPGGLASCIPCAAGSSSSSYTAFYCPSCSPGQYQPNPGQTSCLTCPANTFSWVGATSCQPCPAPTIYGPAGSNSRLNCFQ